VIAVSALCLREYFDTMRPNGLMFLARRHHHRQRAINE
jgi:hypothetical protein